MQGKNQNEHHHWKKKLDELDAVPGVLFNRQAAWESLHSRMGGQQPTRKTWYWIAAACVAIVCSISLFLHFNRAAGTHRDEIVISPLRKTAPVKPVLTSKANEKNIPHPSAQKHNVSKANSPKYSAPQTARLQNNIMVHVKETKDPQLETLPVIKSIQIATSPAVATSGAARKKLAVIHINEIGDPIIENFETVHISHKHAFQFKLADGVVFRESPLAPETKTFPILKTKSASN